MKNEKDEEENRDEERWATFGVQFWLRSIPFFLAVFGILWLPYLFTQKSWVAYDLRPFGPLGDALNGIMGPFISILAAVLVFIAFWVQYKANNQQRYDTEIERFETKYMDLIRLHKENVEEIRITDKYSGRKAFVALYGELRLCFYLVKFHIDQHPPDDVLKDFWIERDDDETILRIAYLIFYLGLGDKSEQLWYEQLRGLCSQFLSQNLRADVLNQQSVTRISYTFRNRDVFSYERTHTPFVGHMADLGHYYRHLYQTVKFVDEAKHLRGNPIEKYKHVKTLRAQLSSYEQILLYYNTFSRFGKPWLDDDHPYLIQYRMIKNIPLPLADFGVKPEVKFAKQVDATKDKQDKFFEWHEANM